VDLLVQLNAVTSGIEHLGSDGALPRICGMVGAIDLCLRGFASLRRLALSAATFLESAGRPGLAWPSL